MENIAVRALAADTGRGATDATDALCWEKREEGRVGWTGSLGLRDSVRREVRASSKSSS
jgi:hypothetical protein